MCFKIIGHVMLSFVLLFSLIYSMASKAEESINMDGMSVIGNKESPNLLYIVRWKSPAMLDMEEPTILTRIFNEALAPVEREVLIREESYRKARHMIRGR
jgi:hypothetical protein